MKKAIKIIMMLGMAFSIVPSISCIFIDEPAWLKESIYDTSLYLFISIILFLIVIWLVWLKFDNKYLNGIFLGTSIPYTIVPGLYLNGAFFLGRQKADFQTWDLLMLFCGHYQMASSLFVGIISVISSFFVYYYVRLRNSRT